MATTPTVLVDGDVLIDAQLHTGDIVAVPAMVVDDLRIYPCPLLQRGEHGHARAVSLDLGCWLISLPDQALLPIKCTSAEAAHAAATAFRADVDRRSITTYTDTELAKWASWWCSHQPTATEIDTTWETQ